MVRITDSERKAILKRYPDAWLKGTKHHTYLAGYESSYAMTYLQRLREREQRQKSKPARKDGRQPRNRQLDRG